MGGGAGRGSFVTNRVEREYYRKWTTDQLTGILGMLRGLSGKSG